MRRRAGMCSMLIIRHGAGLFETIKREDDKMDDEELTFVTYEQFIADVIAAIADLTSRVETLEE